ncbi:tail fiber assembly protein [Xenorhabdus anantnagensis]|uniref:Tail fiber assembly protein n=1 Tax=Xenorhabdus anantnagensis TaxID=3025875 RepID=A0ABT5LMY7_9GAMM|nr:tail fiber assembly protein [Xenorhabdus anantnagensis]MDC9595766.1 tail fiber assembly protein [Xenorhabdus anantnagensis]
MIDDNIMKKNKKLDNGWFYSASKNGFVYRSYDESDNYPDDLKPISDVLYQQMFTGQKSGKLIVAGVDGLPTLNDIPSPTSEELQKQAELEKRRLLKKAAESIGICQDAFDLGIATEKEQAALTQWRFYRVLLNRVDCSTVPDIYWPEQPQ